MGKLLFLVAIGLIAYVVLKFFARHRHSTPAQHPGAGEKMIACAHCRINVPLSEALQSGGQSFCSDEHRRIFDATHDTPENPA